MSHHVYRTDAIVLRRFPEGEASAYLKLLTRDLGLVGATARSVREERSRLRYSLQEYSRSTAALVRGKESWRLVNAVPLRSYSDELKGDRAGFEAAARLLSLVEKLVVGEERNADLFDTVASALDLLADADLSKREVVGLQLLAALRVLHVLGYGESGELSSFASGGRWDAEEAARMAERAEEARGYVRKALAASHLS